MPLWWGSAGQRNELSFLLAVQLALVVAVRWTAVQGCFQPLLGEALAHSLDSGTADLHSLSDGIIRPAWPVGSLVGLEQDAGVGQGAGWSRACGHQVLISCWCCS